MATLNVTEYSDANRQSGHALAVPLCDSRMDFNHVTFTATAVQSTAFGATTRIIRIYATVACYYKIGPSPQVATTDHTYLPASSIERLGVQPGDVISVVAA
jgi:hypothetical protein